MTPPAPTWYSSQTSLMSVAPSLAQIAGAQTLDSWRERVGERTYANGERSDLWVRYLHGEGTHAGGESISDGVGGLAMDARFEHRQRMVQIGVDAYRKEESDRTSRVFGAYVAAGRSSADVWHQSAALPGLAEMAGDIDLDSKIVGLYWTGNSANGTYLDAVVQYADHDFRLGGDTGLFETKASGQGASLEVGRTFNNGVAWSWTPQAQVRWQQVKVDDITVGDGVSTFGTYKFDTNDSLVGRVGIAASYQKQPGFAFWARADVMHEFAGENQTRYVPNIANSLVPTLTSNLSGTRYGLTLGFDARLGKRAALFGSAGYEQASGNSDDNSWNARVGLRVDW